jgi:hypothetical protein
MPGLAHYLRCVGRAALKNGGRALAGLVPFGDVAFEIAQDAYQEYRMDPGLKGFPPGYEPEAVVTVAGARKTYTLRALLAAGDVADVHLATAGNDPAKEGGYLLKTSRQREGSFLLDNERQVLFGLLRAAGDTTYRNYLPSLIESFPARDGSGLRTNVFRHETGWWTLEQVHAQHPSLDGRHLAWIFKRLLTVLGFAHAEQAVHAAVLPCHVLVHAANHGLRLVGWGQSARAGRPVKALCPRYQSWYPPEVHRAEPVSGAADVFLAARCMSYLAGGDPLGEMWPEAVPPPMRRFFETCLLEGPRMRPAAWELIDDFDRMLGRLYGPPKFHPLIMECRSGFPA